MRARFLLACLAMLAALPAGAQNSLNGVTIGTAPGGASVTPAGVSGDLQTNNGAAAFGAAHFNDNGTTITSSESVDFTTNAQLWEVANSSTGTVANELAKLVGASTASQAQVITTSDTSGIFGVVAGGAGTTGNAQIAVSGQVSCQFDGATTKNDYVVASTTSAGKCHDAGVTLPTGVTVVGTVLSTNGGSGLYGMLVNPPDALNQAGLPSDIAYWDKNQSWTAAQRNTPTTLTLSTATATPNFDTGQNFKLVLSSACPCTFANPSTTPVAGQTGVIEIDQDGTGSRTVGTWGTLYVTAGGVASIALSTGANAQDYFSYYVRDSTHIVLATGVLNAVH